MAADFGIIVSSTIQAIVLSCISNVLAQLISSYQNEVRELLIINSRYCPLKTHIPDTSFLIDSCPSSWTCNS